MVPNPPQAPIAVAATSGPIALAANAGAEIMPRAAA